MGERYTSIHNSIRLDVELFGVRSVRCTIGNTNRYLYAMMCAHSTPLSSTITTRRRRHRRHSHTLAGRLVHAESMGRLNSKPILLIFHFIIIISFLLLVLLLLRSSFCVGCVCVCAIDFSVLSIFVEARPFRFGVNILMIFVWGLVTRNGRGEGDTAVVVKYRLAAM